MSDEKANGEHHGEIIIVHRHGDHEDGHHGGAWKIAFADFMTAMMTFFLVMWLINSTDEQTLAQVATYFSPIKLTDRTVTERGVHDAEFGGAGKETEDQKDRKKEGKGIVAPKQEPGERRFPEEALFADPYDTLAKLASQAVKIPPQAAGGLRKDGRAGGEAFRDPFDPDFRRNTYEGPVEGGDMPLKPEGAATKSPPGIPGKEGGVTPGPETEVPPADASDSAEKTEMAPPPESSAEAEKPQVNAAPGNEKPVTVSVQAKMIEKELRQSLHDTGLLAMPDISVTSTPEGVLISLTDKMNFEMFAVSSAEPRPELVVVMEDLAKVLAKQAGKVVLRGHTDGRPFRSKTYDNWRLSAARAHISYYMLVRGGVNKDRFERIEGHADRSLKVPSNPRAAANRRIEILLRPATV